MTLTGYQFIAGNTLAEGKKTFYAFNPSTGKKVEPPFYEAISNEIAEAVEQAYEAFKIYSKIKPVERALFLDTIADEILNLGDNLVARCCLETGLPEGRIIGERGRTINQLKLFANVLREGSWVDARIDTAISDRQPVPKPDIRSMQKPLGVVGVFGASNFPLAFSVAGGDTASALACGCPVVVKAHPSHPGTCELIAKAITKAIKICNMPKGTFSMVQGVTTEVGMGIVTHSLIKAIGFTGSFRGGIAIFDAANKRPEPIPVYAEMGSVNPVFILPNMLKEKGEVIAQGLTDSVTLGIGQFCTNPGVVFVEETPDILAFEKRLSEHFEQTEAGTMLNKSIKSTYDMSVANLISKKKISLLAQGKENSEGYKGTAHIFKSSIERFLKKDYLEEEVFGPSTILFYGNKKTDFLAAAEKLKGHLTASIFGTKEELIEYQDLIAVLEQKVGRLIINNFPTGVEVCHSIIHGGPFPATTNSRSTSVGTAAINRFTRPICYQNFPQELLPDELKDGNPMGIFRLVDGIYKN